MAWRCLSLNNICFSFYQVWDASPFIWLQVNLPCWGFWLQHIFKFQTLFKLSWPWATEKAANIIITNIDMFTFQQDIEMAKQYHWFFPGQLKHYYRTQHPDECLVLHPVTPLPSGRARTPTPEYPWSSTTMGSCFGILLQKCLVLSYSHSFHCRVLRVFVFCSYELNNATRIIYAVINSTFFSFVAERCFRDWKQASLSE